MSTVTVNCQFKAYKVKVTPSTNLNDILRQSLKHFKLDEEFHHNGSVRRWILLYKGKEITMDLPWRLMNLPAGCKLDLINIQTNGNTINGRSTDMGEPKDGPSSGHAPPSSSVGNNIIKMRFQISGRGYVVQQINPMDSITDTFKNIGEIKNWHELCSTDTLQKLKFRVMSSVYDYSMFNGKRFHDLGISESISVNIELPSSLTSESESETNIPVNTSIYIPKEETKKDNNTKHELHKPTVYLPSSDRLSVDEDANYNDNVYELSIEHAKMYQNMLLKQTGNLGGPLMTRRLREEKLKQTREAHGQNVKECLMRIKFPDRSYLEITFKPNETMRTVYEEISKNLSDCQSKFNLYQTHPHVLLPCNDQLLVDDLKFTSKNVIILEFEDPTKKGPFLKDTLLANAKSIIETLERNHDPDLKDSDLESTSSTSKDTSIQKIKPKKSLNGIPKWLKLSKK